jgi:metal-sulfur cluster biosynthetic enzyme
MSAEPRDRSTRDADVRACLEGVMDPELDASLTELEFIESLTVKNADVHVKLRLPTFFCSANFAWIMAEDAKDAIEALDWTQSVSVELVDHFAMHRINPALAAGQGFQAAFGREATADLSSVRRDFRDKAFLGRQSIVIDALRRVGWSAIDIVGLDLAGLASLDLQGEQADARDSYLVARRLRGDAGDAALAFVDLQGGGIPPASLLDHLRASRRIRGGFEANGEMCRILLAARYAPGGRVDPDHENMTQRKEVTHDNG